MFTPAEGCISPPLKRSSHPGIEPNMIRVTGSGVNARTSIGKKRIIVAARRMKYTNLLKPSFTVRSKCALGNLGILTTAKKSHENATRIFIMASGAMIDISNQSCPRYSRRVTSKGPSRGTRIPIIELISRKNSA